MAYKQLPIVQEEFATTKYANQIKDNFDAIVGGQILRESLTQLSNRLTSVAGQFGQYNEEIQRLITEFNSLKADIDKALDNIDLRFNELSADVVKKITTVSDNLKRLEDSTGYNTNLHQYFKNVNQARNLVLAINKLHEDLGNPKNLTTTLKENAITAINELDMDIGNVSSITDSEIKSTNLSQIIINLKTLLGVFNSINSNIRQNNFVNSINNLYTILLQKIEDITLKNGKNINISSNKNIDVLGGVSKDYSLSTKYYKNDFIWNENILYKAKKDFTSTNFESDLDVNLEEIKTGSDLSTAKVVNTYKEDTVFEPGDIVFVTENTNEPGASITVTGRQVFYDNQLTNLTANNVQDAIDKILNEKISTSTLLNLVVPIGSTYIQFTDNSGNFLEKESPSSLFPNTQWQLMFNTESMYFRTEGSLSESGRTNGIQGDAGRNAVGSITFAQNLVDGSNGVFRSDGSFYHWNNVSPSDNYAYAITNFDLSRIYTTANEFRTINRLMRMYKRIA